MAINVNELIDYELISYYDGKIKEWVTSQIQSQVSSAVKYKGSVANVASLPNNAHNGDMYNVREDDINRVWNSEDNAWDPYGPSISIDTATTAQIDELFSE